MRNEDAGAVIDRMHLILNVARDIDVAEALGVAVTTVSSWRSRNSVPYAYCVALAKAHMVALDWLLLGEGPMLRGTEAPAAAPAAAAVEDFEEWLGGWWPAATDRERMWLDVQLELHIPPYKEWRTARLALA